MLDLVVQVKENIQKYNLIEEDESIVVGVSGGPDSIFLLHALVLLKNELKFSINVAHINHGLRKEAIHDENLVRKFCAEHGLPIYVLNADVLSEAKMLKISTEECGRNIRYDFFNKILNETDSKKIVVAHNLGDNAETVLLNLTRGTGLNGLCGMKYQNGNIIRPMLNISKADIIIYLENNNIKYAIDKTNLESDYTRNFIRNEIIPNFEKLNPNFSSSIYRMCKVLKDDEKILDNFACREAKQVILEENSNDIVLDVKAFRNIPKEIKSRSVRCILSKLLDNMQGIEQVHVEDIVTLLDKCITGKKYIIGNKFYIEILKNKKAKCVKATTIVEK